MINFNANELEHVNLIYKIVILLLVVFSFIFVLFSLLPKDTSTIEQTSDSTSVVEVENPVVKDQVVSEPVHFEYSPDETYKVSFSNLGRGQSTTCNLRIFKGDVEIDVSDIIDLNEVGCSTYMRISSMVFTGWSGESSIIFEPTRGDVVIVNLEDLSFTEYSYDESKYTFISSYYHPENFLSFTHQVSKHEVDFKIFDYTSGDLAFEKNFTVDESNDDLSNNVRIFYDPVNDGYLIMQRIYDTETAETYGYFLDVAAFETKQVLYVLPVEYRGSGCYPPEIQSIELGEILFSTGGCFPGIDEPVLTINLRDF